MYCVRWNLVNCCTTVRKITFEKTGKSVILQAIYHFLLVVCSISVSTLHRFPDITSFTVYVTACDLDRSFSLNTTVEITGYVHFPIHV